MKLARSRDSSISRRSCAPSSAPSVEMLARERALQVVGDQLAIDVGTLQSRMVLAVRR